MTSRELEIFTKKSFSSEVKINLPFLPYARSQHAKRIPHESERWNDVSN